MLEGYGYTRYSQDEVKGKDLEKYRDIIINDLIYGKKVVLDATFAKEEKRLFWIKLIKDINEKNHTKFNVHILWNIRPGQCFNNLRPKETKVSHFAYTGQYGYTPNFSDPYLS